MKQLFSLLICISIPLLVLAQEDFTWGLVPKEDLSMTSYEKDLDAQAVVLAETGEIFIDIAIAGQPKCILNKNIRIKILEDGGLDYADISIPFHHGGGYQEITYIEGATYNEGEEAQILLEKDIHTTVNNEYWSETNFAMPNVKKGSIIEYRYTITTESLFQLPTWYFQASIPKKWSRVTLRTPDLLNYLFIKNSTLEIESNKSSTEYSQTFFNSSKTNSVTELITLNTFNFIIQDIPAFKELQFLPHEQDYYHSIHFQLESTQDDKGKKTPTTNTWDLYANRYFDHTNFGKQYTSKSNYKKIAKMANSIIDENSDAKTKIAALSDFILDNIKWNEDFSVFTDKNLNKIFSSESASSSEMNLMLVALLNHFEIEAHALLISTRGNGKVIQAYPLSNQFNHVIVYIPNDKKPQLIDLTAPKFSKGLLNRSALNGEGLLIKKDGFEWITLDIPNTSKTVMASTEITKEGNAQSNLKVISDNYEAHYNRSWYDEKESDQEYVESFIKESFDISEDVQLEVKNEKELDKRMFTEADVNIKNYANASGDLMYIPIMFTDNWEWLEDAFKEESREFPLMLPYPFKDKFVNNITLPEGYVVDELPESVKFSTADGNATFSFLAEAKKGRIQIITELKSSSYFYESHQYSGLQELFKIVFEKMGEMIVLKKQG